MDILSKRRSKDLAKSNYPTPQNGQDKMVHYVKSGSEPSENIPTYWLCSNFNDVVFMADTPKNTKELWNIIIGRPQRTPERIDRIFRQGIRSITKMERENIIDRHQREAMVRIVTEHYLTIRIYDYLKDSPFGFIISPSK